MDSFTVLVVEDDRAEARLLRTWLAESAQPRFRASHVTRLADANNRADAIAYDAVLLDLALPDSAGLDTVARFRQANPDTAIVVVTGSDDSRLAASTVQLGAHEFAPKDTLDGHKLALTITRAIARHRLSAGGERLLAQIRGNTSKLRSILHAHPDGILLHDSAARVVYANAAAELLLGCRVGQPLPTPLVRSDPHWRGAMRIEGEPDDLVDVEVDATAVRWKDDAVAGVLFLRVVAEHERASVRLGSTSRATLMASLDAMSWRIEGLRADLARRGVGGSRSTVSDTAAVLSDLRRLVEDARSIVTGARAHPPEP